ncbi:MAG TPA: SPFH domain-containing protein [Pontimonas sp.]|nr:SPFH domain-containing protein [Pontimonas sp.]
MGLIQAGAGAIGGTLGDQWKDFLTVPRDIAPTAALFPAVQVGTNAGRGSNRSGSEAIITNGSKIVVPEGYGLLLFENGRLTGFVNEPGGYTWTSDSTYSQSIFAGDPISQSLLKQSWERFKFGGIPGEQQLALFVRLAELPNNRFGTQSAIYWDDGYLNAQVGAITYGTYSVTIIDPLTFATRLVPATYLQGQGIFDFTDRSNPVSEQLFTEVVSSLAAAFSSYANDPSKGNRITKIQQDSIGFTQSLSHAVESNYSWQAGRGLSIAQVTIMGIQYDEHTQELLKTVQRADALTGQRGNSNLQASVAEGIQTAGSSGGSEGILGLGIAGGSIGVSGMMQNEPAPAPASPDTSEPDDLVAQLEKLKRALDAGLIEQSDYDAAKAKLLGL